MEQNCKSCQKIELEDFLICDKCKKNCSLIKEEVPISDKISVENKKYNSSKIYESIQKDNFINNKYECCKKFFILLFIILFIFGIIVYIYFSYIRKINDNNSALSVKNKEIIKRKLDTKSLEISLKVNNLGTINMSLIYF